MVRYGKMQITKIIPRRMNNPKQNSPLLFCGFLTAAFCFLSDETASTFSTTDDAVVISLLTVVVMDGVNEGRAVLVIGVVVIIGTGVVVVVVVVRMDGLLVD